MSSKKINVSVELKALLLAGSNPEILQLLTPINGLPNGQDGRFYDWSKFDWKGEQIHIDKCHHMGCEHGHECKAYPPFIDGKGSNTEYLHVPYDWIGDCTVYRIWPVWDPGDTVRINRSSKMIIKVQAIKLRLIEESWYWRIIYERA